MSDNEEEYVLTFDGPLVLPASPADAGTLIIEPAKHPVVVVFDDGHREPLELPEDGYALEVRLDATNPLEANAPAPILGGVPRLGEPVRVEGLGRALALLRALTAALRPPSGQRHGLLLVGGQLVVHVMLGRDHTPRAVMATLDDEDMVRPIEEIVASIVAFVRDGGKGRG